MGFASFMFADDLEYQAGSLKGVEENMDRAAATILFLANDHRGSIVTKTIPRDMCEGCD